MATIQQDAVAAHLSKGVGFLGMNKDHPADINRYLGGFERGESSHPFVKGYFYVFMGFPTALFKANATDGFSIDPADALTYTLSAAEGWTPPGDRQLKTEDLMGMGGVDASFITGQTIDRNFSIQYRDYWGAPLFRIHRQWTQYLNPYYGGVTEEIANAGALFMAQEYKGTCMVIQTKPITKTKGSQWQASDIIKIDYFDGVFPITDLKSAYDSNITDNSIAKPTVQYRFDGFPLDETNKAVMGKATILLSSIQYGNLNASPAIYEALIQDGTLLMGSGSGITTSGNNMPSVPTA
jgi:hypothetical protein